MGGMRIYHNFIRPHEGLDGKTPAEACGIKIEGKNKWLTLIQKWVLVTCHRNLHHGNCRRMLSVIL